MAKVRKYFDLHNISYFLTDGFVSFCVGGSVWDLRIENLGRLPKKSCPIDTFIFKNNFEMNDKEFNEGLDLLYKYIFEEDNVEFLKWLEASYYYYILQERHFIPDEKPAINDSFTELVKQKKFDYSDIAERNHNLKINDTENIIYKTYELEKNKYYKNIEIKKDSGLFEKMFDGWKNVDEEVFARYKRGAFFNKFTIEQLKDCVENWQNEDLELFRDFISERYKMTRKTEDFTIEIKILVELNVIIKRMFELEKKGRRKGSLYNLSNTIKAVSDCYL